jgi:hypothetical protein
VTETEGVAQDIHLAVTVGAFGKFVHFLQQCQVGLVVGDHIGDPVRIVAPIHAADALVDVVAQELEFHEIYLLAGIRNPILCQLRRVRATLSPARPARRHGGAFILAWGNLPKKTMLMNYRANG